MARSNVFYLLILFVVLHLWLSSQHQHSLSLMSNDDLAYNDNDEKDDCETMGSSSSSPQSPIPSSIRPKHSYQGLCQDEIIGERQQKYGSKKKVISVSMFVPAGKESMEDWVLDGWRVLLDQVRVYYPDWILRLYTAGLPVDEVQSLVEPWNHVEAVVCGAQPSNARMMLYRFLVVDDPTVGLSIVRDLDSRFSLRELMAVNEFIASDQHLFHVMRDHDQHTVPVMGGMFGMKHGLFDSDDNDDNSENTATTTTMTSLVQRALRDYPLPRRIPGCCAEDQSFLERYVWPLAKHKCMDHDMDPRRCRLYGSNECRSFPLGPRNDATNFFVGAPFKGNHDFTESSGYKCTIQCS